MKTIKLLLMLALTVGFAIGQDGDVTEQYAEAVTAIENGDWNGAEELLKSILSTNADYAPALVQLAHIAVRNSEMDKTKDYLRQAIDIEPENEEYRAEYNELNEVNKFMSQAARELDAGEYDNATNSYLQVMEKYPYMTEAIYIIGIVKLRQEDYDGAVNYFNQALVVNPDHEKSMQSLTNVARKLYNEANNFKRRKDLTSALELYKKVVKIDNSIYQAHYQIGQVERGLKNYDNAINSYSDAVEAKPDFYLGWYSLGLTKKAIRNTKDALDAFQKTIDLNPSYAKAYCAMGDIYYNTNQIEKAKLSCQQAIQADPTFAQPYVKLAEISINEKDYDQALINLETATALDRKDASAWYMVAQVQNNFGNCEEAKVAARKSLDISDRFGGAWVELGIAEYCGGSGNKTAALNALERAKTDRTWKSFAEHEMGKIRNPQKYEN